ncbi:protein wech [Episyrphus balteatus]|uniref:protein wech n=1 Tax=Episyrphus balteatus TaxID=286459 RepID=UPI0024867DA1|nr:protein wech [Episyrphus balteatus]
MELVTNNNLPHGTKNVPPHANTNSSTETLLAGILDSFPAWELNTALLQSTQISSPVHNDFLMNGMFSTQPTQPLVRNSRMSPGSSNSSSSSIHCGAGCDSNASIRCLDCNEFMCNNCLRDHRNSPLSSNHSVISLPSPIGSTSTGGMPTVIPGPAFMCDLHNEIYRYVCEYCKKLVCQCCTLREHKDHDYTSIQSFVEEAKEKIDLAIESSRMGTKCVKGSIDKALAFIRLIERNCAELSDNIRKSFRQFMIAIEDRERFLLDFVEKLRQRRLALLHDQMAGLKSTLSGLSETSDMLLKVYENSHLMEQIEVALKITNGQRQLEQFAAIFKDLQPRQELFAFVPPDFTILGDIRNQGGVVVVDDKNIPIEAGSLIPLPASSGLASSTPHSAMTAAAASRRPILRDVSFRVPTPLTQRMPNPGLDWEISLLRTSPALQFGAPRITQCIAGSSDHIKVRNSNLLTLSFATEGHDDGQVSRPWGLCVDKMGNILISDRRNNRVQVFNPDGTFKFKFGRKGVGNAEFDLPAGICTDCDNRIIVVDKDNHRVQIFSANGIFLSKFGTFGKEYGQFQYPWDVAVNSRRQIAVTDSRNHRIQQFDSEGRFIRQIVFDNNGPSKSIAAPRGICYTPQGNIIVSDFDNHCLYLIDPDVNEIISAKGQEGCGFQEFNRPSGLCCDDEGRIIVADSKNQRVIVFSPNMDYLWDIEIRPSVNPQMPCTLDEKDRTCDVALMPDGRVVFLIELSPDSKEGSNPHKRFVHVY